jgi:hypothetical protein
MGGAAGRLGLDRHPQAPTRLEVGQHHRQGARVAYVRARHHLQPGAHIGDMAGHHALHHHELRHDRHILGRDDRGTGHDARGGLDGGDTAAVGRVAQRSADVVAKTEWAHPRRQRSALAAARPACCATGHPRVVGDAVQARFGEHPQPEVGQVGAADGDGTCGTHPLDHRCIDRRDRVGERCERLRGGRAGEVDVLLHRDRHTVERAERFARSDGAVGRLGCGTGLVVEATDDGVELWVHLVDAGQVGVDHLTAAHLSPGDHLGQFERPVTPQLGAHSGRSPVAFLVVP